jgi:hypothetical protein
LRTRLNMKKKWTFHIDSLISVVFACT